MKNLVNDIQYTVVKPSGVGSGSLYISHSSDDDSDRGSLVFFIELETSDRDNEAIITDLEAELTKQYFNSPTDSIEYAFENALAKANVSVKDTLLSKPKNWLSKMHIIVMAASEEEVHLSHVGNAHAFLTHHDHVADILDNTSSQRSSAGYVPKTPNPVKLFSNIISGKLGLSDSITIVTDPVLDYLSADRIRKTTNDNTSLETVEKLAELLAKTSTSKQFGLLVLKRTATAVKNSAPVTQKQEIPVSKPITREEIVNQYLKPEMSGDQEHPMTQAPALIDLVRDTVRRYGSALITFILNGASKAMDQVLIAFKKIRPKISSLPSIMASMWRNRKSRDYHFSKVKESTKATVQSLPKKFSALPGNRKLVIALVGILIVAFAASVSWRAQHNAQQEAKAAYEETLSDIEQKRDQAQATIIYKEYERARQIINEALLLLEGLPRSNSDQAADHDRLMQELTVLRDRSEKKIVIGEMTPFVTVIPSPVSPQTSGILTDGENIFYYDGVEQRIASIDLANQLVLSFPLENQGIEDFNTALYTENNTIVALRTDTALFIDTEDETVRKELFTYDPAIQSYPFASYLGNLYTINPSSNEIIRYREAGRGFTTAQSWLTEPYDLSQMKDIAVDGFVYTLHANGDVHVFLRGTLNKVIPFPLDKKPGDGVRFFMRENFKHIYILDPANSRLIKMTTSGELVAQYIADMLSNASSIAIPDGEERTFILSEDSVYVINL